MKDQEEILCLFRIVFPKYQQTTGVALKQATRVCQRYHMTSMTKCIPVHKNTTGNCGQDAEEESSASEGETETVGKPTGKATDTQKVWDITETVTEERAVEEIPPNTWEKAL